jgi:hypothetical protein
MTSTLRAAIIEAAHDLIREGITTLTDFTEPTDDPADLPDQRAAIDEVVEIRGARIAVWPFGAAPAFAAAPLADGIVVPCADGACGDIEGHDGPPYGFVAYVTFQPFGLLVQVGRHGDPGPLRTLWWDGEEATKALVDVGVAHLVGSPLLEYVGPEGEDPRQAAVTVPDTIPDGLG